MACCSRSPGFDPKVTLRIGKRLDEVLNIFPGTNHIVLLSADGQKLYQRKTDKESKERDAEQKSDYLIASVAQFRKAASVFGATLQQVDCPVIHIRGNNHIFSCYDVGSNLLVLYSEMHSASVEAFNTTAADKKMEPILGDVLQLVRDLTVSK